MIRINLLTVESARPKRKKRVAIDLAQKVPIACSLILVLTGVGLGWWYWSLQQEFAQLQQEIATAESETIRLRNQIGQVRNLDSRKTQLMQRVNLIETLRRGQSGPVHLLDEISKALPEMLWLTTLTQQALPSNEVTIEGRCVNLTSVSDFIANLQSSPYFRGVDLGETSTEQPSQAPGAPQIELTKFTIKATFAPPAK